MSFISFDYLGGGEGGGGTPFVDLAIPALTFADMTIGDLTVTIADNS